VYPEFRLNHGKRGEIVIFKSLSTTFEMSDLFGTISTIGLSLKLNRQIKQTLIHILSED